MLYDNFHVAAGGAILNFAPASSLTIFRKEFHMFQKSKKYFASLENDIPASIVVFLVALPLCLGIALGSGAPLFSGIIGGIIGGIVVGVLSGSQLSITGPAAGLTAIVAVAIGKLPAFEAFLLVVVISGVIQYLLGLLKAGILGDYVPSSVIRGMIVSIGIILILKQLPHLLGYDADFGGDESFVQNDGANTFSEIFNSIRYFLPTALGIGVVSLIIQMIWDKIFFKKGGFFFSIPAALIVVLVGISINLLLQKFYPAYALQQTHLVNVPAANSAKEFISFFSFPDLSYIGNITVWTTALTLAIVATLETLLNIEAADELDEYKRVTPANRELKAQGIGNIVSGLIGGLPISSVIVRTSANINAGAKTKMSAILQGVLLLVSVALIPRLLNHIPLPSIAAVLIYIGYKLARVSIFRDYYKKGWDQFMPFIVTVLAILLTDILIGILIGCAVGLFFLLRSNFRSAVFVVTDKKNYLLRLRKDVSFLNKPIIKRNLEKISKDSSVLIDVSRADFIDRDVVEVIEDFMKHAHLKNIKVDLKRSNFKEQGFNKPIHTFEEIKGIV